MRNFLLLGLLLLSSSVYADGKDDKTVSKLDSFEQQQPQMANVSQAESNSRLTIGGYGEMTMSRHFYSDAWQRYSLPANYANDEGYGRFDIPRAVFMIGYDFGKGWSFGSEIEFEHGGTGTTVEVEEEETGEYESETEQGGEVVLEQFWINKSWSDALNLKMGHIVLPIGYTNKYHLPTQYFGVSRPEGDVQIIPTVWHQTGISFWGELKDWDYEVMFVAGLDADRFSPENWIGGSSGSIYEFEIANSYAGAFSLNNSSIKNLTLGVSGYYGHSAKNTLNSYGYSNTSRGAIAIGSFDFTYKPKNFIVRGGAIYGSLSDTYAISVGNANATNAAPTPGKPAVASKAISVGVEAGYNIFSLSDKLTSKGESFYLFGRYDYYDSMYETVSGVPDYKYWERECVAFGINYSPIKQIVIKAEYQMRNLVDPSYNDENTLSVGVMWAGFFTKRQMR